MPAAAREGAPMTLRLYMLNGDVMNVIMMTAVGYGSGFAMTILLTAHADHRLASRFREHSDYLNSEVVDPSGGMTS